MKKTKLKNNRKHALLAQQKHHKQKQTLPHLPKCSGDIKLPVWAITVGQKWWKQIYNYRVAMLFLRRKLTETAACESDRSKKKRTEKKNSWLLISSVKMVAPSLTVKYNFLWPPWFIFLLFTRFYPLDISLSSPVGKCICKLFGVKYQVPIWCYRAVIRLKLSENLKLSEFKVALDVKPLHNFFLCAQQIQYK